MQIVWGHRSTSFWRYVQFYVTMVNVSLAKFEKWQLLHGVSYCTVRSICCQYHIGCCLEVFGSVDSDSCMANEKYNFLIGTPTFEMSKLIPADQRESAYG